MRPHHEKPKLLSITLLTVSILLFLSLSSLLIITQTSLGKNYIKNHLIKSAEKQGVAIAIEKFEGRPPLQYQMENVSIKYSGHELFFDSLKLKISFFPLFNKNIVFDYFKAKNIAYSNKSGPTSKIEEAGADIREAKKLSFGIYFKHLDLEHLQFVLRDEKITLDITGNGKILKNLKQIASDLNIKREEYKEAFIKLKASTSKNILKISSTISTDTVKLLSPLIPALTVDGSFSIEVTALGPLSSYFAFVQNAKKLPEDIIGSIQGSLFALKHLQPRFDRFFQESGNFYGEFQINKEFDIKLTGLNFSNPFFSILGILSFDRSFSLQKGDFTLFSRDLSKLNPFFPVKFEGSLVSKTTVANKTLDAVLEIDNFKIDFIVLKDFKSKLTADFANNFQAALDASAISFNQPMHLLSTFTWSAENLLIDKFTFTSPSSALNFTAAIDNDFLINGQGKLELENLSQVAQFLPNYNINAQGSLAFELLTENKNEQKAALKADLTNFHVSGFIGKSLSVSSKITDPFNTRKGNYLIELDNCKYKALNIDKIKIETDTHAENWPFEIAVNGNWERSLTMNLSGFWHKDPKELTINLQDITGTILGHPFLLPNPVKFEYGKDVILLDDFNIALASSSLHADMKIEKENVAIKINAKHFPLDFLSFNPMDVQVNGFANIDILLTNSFSQKSVLDFDIESINIYSMLEKEPFSLSGFCKAIIDDNVLSSDARFEAQNSQFLQFTSAIPVKLRYFPFSFAFDLDNFSNANFVYNGKIEELLDYVNIGAERLEGQLDCKLSLNGRLKDPEIEGYCNFNEGVYENYFTGSYFKNINANLTATKDIIELKFLKGQDAKEGSFDASGHFSLSETKKYPYAFSFNARNLISTATDLVFATINSTIKVFGNIDEGMAEGAVNLLESRLNIPSSIPIALPKLPIKYINNPAAKETKGLKRTVYPLKLNLELNLINPILVQGQGVDSAWSGNFKIGGTYSNLQTFGSLNLDKGSYSFSGRVFELTKGSLQFMGEKEQMPYLDLFGKMSQGGVNITANLKGPLDNLKLFFQSDPPLPAGSIMSIVLFGKDIPAISGAQTVELSKKMISNLDEGGLTNENSPGSLGVERYNVIDTNPYDLNNPNSNLNFGHYIARGVSVSFSQGNAQAGNNIIVEVDLSGGYFFVAESQTQDQDQAKFGLQWRRNY